MKKIENEIKIDECETYFYRSLTSETIETKFEVKLYLTKEKFEVFKDSVSRGKIKLLCEVEDPILDDAERKYLREVIEPFRDKVKCIIKRKSFFVKDAEYISIELETQELISFPWFKNSKMYKGMKVNREYSLEELGL